MNPEIIILRELNGIQERHPEFSDPDLRREKIFRSTEAAMDAGAIEVLRRVLFSLKVQQPLHRAVDDVDFR